MVVILIVSLVFIALYFTISSYVFIDISKIINHCAEYSFNTPDDFEIDKHTASDFKMTNYKQVQIPNGKLKNSGWFITHQDKEISDTKTVIVIHGLGTCKRSPRVLLTAGVLYRGGFNVLMIDLIDHGDSSFDDGRHAGGVKESIDIINAFNWLKEEKKIDSKKIGIMGASFGASTSLIAMGENNEIKTVWADSSYSDLLSVAKDELKMKRYPTIFARGIILTGQLITGESINERTPYNAIKKTEGKNIMLTHGDMDTRIDVKHAYKLYNSNNTNNTELWIISNSEHVQGIIDQNDIYQEKLLFFFNNNLQ